jgi:hypothetical protein
MANNIVAVDSQDIANNLVLHVTLRREKQWRWRLAVGSWLIRLAAWVMWMNIDIETDW